MNVRGLVRILSGFLIPACMILELQPTQTGITQAANSAPHARMTLRVGMWTLWHDHEVTLTPVAHDELSVMTCEGCAALNFASPVNVTASGETLRIEGANKSESASRIIVRPSVSLLAHNETVTLHNPVAISARDGALVITVTMPIESYVERVVASESGPADTAESLKSLAMVVRSFALHQSHGHADYDLCDSTHCQLLHWSGDRGHRAAAHAATLATSGETLWFHGQPALAYFSKDCGGRTAAPSEIWPRARNLPYLPSQSDQYCTTASDSREWATQISRADLTAALASRGVARAGWRHLAIARRGESGRVVTLRLDANEVNAEDFHLAVGESLGWNQLPSTWFEVNQQGDRFYFHGRGRGHGVGLCQKGAAAMAAQNRTAAQILAQYFPGTEPTDENTGHAWKSYARDGFVLESLEPADAVYLPDLERTHAEAMQRSGLNTPQPITIRSFVSTPAFRSATGAPGWVAAFTEGDWIGTQPLRTLASRRLLDATICHEFLHALVEYQSGPTIPLWFREGLVELWSDPGAKHAATANGRPDVKLDAIDAMLAHPNTEADSAAAHRAALYYASRLVTRHGGGNARLWLRSGLPATIVADLGQR